MEGGVWWKQWPWTCPWSRWRGFLWQNKQVPVVLARVSPEGGEGLAGGKVWAGPGHSELGAGAASHLPQAGRGHRALEQLALSSLCLCHYCQELGGARAVRVLNELLFLWKNS